jgi:hypothetical protein
MDSAVTREQALTQVFLGKGKPRVSMTLLLPSKQPLQKGFHARLRETRVRNMQFSPKAITVTMM